MRLTSVQEFLQVLRKSSLLTPAQMDEVSKWPKADPQSFAKRLVQEGLLTEWQAQQLVSGKFWKGHFFLGKYKLLDLIGEGGMGAIYRAVQPSIGRTVALKVMSREILKDPLAIIRFLREMRSAAAVDHPNIVRAYDADCDGDTYFLVMEYVPGKDLGSWIQQEKILPVGWSCECIRQAALGLEHAFEQGMVHRDIKPSNLLVAQAEHGGLPLVKILDLGLARFASDSAEDGNLTRSNQVLGTPDYIAPEQARNTKMADIRSDIFSLGCTLFELLTGRLPFSGDTLMEKLMARAAEDAPAASSWRVDIPPGLDAVLAKMLARDPNARYATPAEVAKALAPFAIGTAGTTAAPARLSAGPANPSGSFDTQSDATSNLLPVGVGLDDLHHASPPTTTARSSERAQTRKLRIAAAIAVTAVIFGLGGSLRPARKSSSTATTAKLSGHSKQHKLGTTTDLLEVGSKSPQQTSPIPDWETALWILKLGGTLEIEALSQPGVNSQEDASVESPQHESRSIQVLSVADLPAGGFEITGVVLHKQINLRRTDFERLARLKHLERLDLADTRFSNADLAPLEHAVLLTRVHLRNTEVSEKGVAILAKFPKLQRLDLGGARVSSAAAICLNSLKSLVDLSLEGAHIQDEGFLQWTESTQLMTLNLAGAELGRWGLNHLKISKLTNLKELDLSRQPIHESLPYLRVGELESVRVLRLTRAKLIDDDLMLLSGMTRLTDLVLASTQIGSDGLKHLTRMSQLERLDLQETFIDDAGLNSLIELLSLKWLKLRGTSVTDVGAGELHGLSRLEFVDLAETNVTRHGVDALKKALPNCKIEY